jgi:hypothetical protein
VLVDGFGQKPHSLDLGGHIVKWQFQDGLDYVQGDATAAYEGRLKRARRHVILLKPDVVVIADDLEAPRPSTFQWMLHGQQPFVVDEPAQQLVLDRGTAGVVVDYAAEEPLGIRQWTGYDPEPDKKLIADSGFMPIPPQWHVEASSTRPSERVFVLTVLRVFRRGQAPGALVRTGRGSSGLTLRIGEVIEMVFPSGNDFALVRRGERQWRIE